MQDVHKTLYNIRIPTNTHYPTSLSSGPKVVCSKLGTSPRGGISYIGGNDLCLCSSIVTQFTLQQATGKGLQICIVSEATRCLRSKSRYVFPVGLSFSFWFMFSFGL